MDTITPILREVVTDMLQTQEEYNGYINLVTNLLGEESSVTLSLTREDIELELGAEEITSHINDVMALVALQLPLYVKKKQTYIDAYDTLSVYTEQVGNDMGIVLRGIQQKVSTILRIQSSLNKKVFG